MKADEYDGARETHSSRGLSPAGGGLLPKPAGRPTAFIFIAHTLIGTDRPHTARKKMCVLLRKSIFQGQHASLKIILPPLLNFAAFDFFFGFFFFFFLNLPSQKKKTFTMYVLNQGNRHGEKNRGECDPAATNYVV